MQERHNSIANELELSLLALTHRYLDIDNIQFLFMDLEYVIPNDWWGFSKRLQPLKGISNHCWGHDMEMLPALLVFCEGNPLVTSRFPSQRASDAKLGVDVSLNKQWVELLVIWDVVTLVWCHCCVLLTQKPANILGADLTTTLSQIAMTFRLNFNKHWSDTIVPDWCLINVNPRIFAIWDLILLPYKYLCGAWLISNNI